MQVLEHSTSIPTLESQPVFRTQKETKLVAIWEIDNRDPNNRKLMCRWIQI